MRKVRTEQDPRGKLAPKFAHTPTPTQFLGETVDFLMVRRT